MSSEDFKGKSPLDIAREAERDLNSNAAKTGVSDSTTESGVDTSIETQQTKFPGATVTYGSEASGAGDNRAIPLSEGGDVDPKTGQLYKARDFEGEGGPEDKREMEERERGGDDDVGGNVKTNA